MNIHNQSEVLDFGEHPVTSVEAKLAILAFNYNWADVVEQEEKIKNNKDISGPHERLPQTKVKDTADIAVDSSTSELDNSKEESKSLYDPNISNEANDFKDTVNTNICPKQRDCHLLQLAEKVIQNAETYRSCNASPEKSDESPQMDNSVIKSMQRLVHIVEAKSGIVIGEIHAQYMYLPPESDADDRPTIKSTETKSGTTISQESQGLDVLENSKISDGKTAKCSNGNRTMKKLNNGMEIIDTEITLLSTEMIQGSRSESDAANDYFTRHPLMRLFLCGTCCCSKKSKTKDTEKVGLLQRIRKFFCSNYM